MNLYNRIGMYLFVIGAILALLDSAFPVSPEMRGVVYIVLLFTGIFSGILNISADEEHHFLLSGAAFLLIILAFNQVFAGQPIIGFFSRLFQNAVAFVGSMALIVALKIILEFGSDDNRVTPLESMELRTERLDELSFSPKLKAWHFTVFLATALTFILLLVELFFTLAPMVEKVIRLFDWIVVIIFAVDLVVLYKQAESFKKFLHNSWLDIIATIPFHGIFGTLKLVRLGRLAKLVKLSHSFKFFSKDSGVNTYLNKREIRTDDLAIEENPRAKGKSKKSAKG